LIYKYFTNNSFKLKDLAGIPAKSLTLKDRIWEGRVPEGPNIPMNTVHMIDCSEARRIVDLIVEKAAETQKAIAVAVADPHGELIAFVRMDSVALPSIGIAINKAFTAARARKPTQEIGDSIRQKANDIAYYGDPRFVGWGGGIPILRDGNVIGAVGVSGLSSAEDAALAALGVDLIANS